jgi:hypothetical protein
MSDPILYVNKTIRDEHDYDEPRAKRVLVYGWDVNNLQKVRLAANSDGSLIMDSKETTNFEGAPVTVGTSAIAITFAGTTQAIHISSDDNNSGYIYIGKSNVTSAGANAMEKLEPGASISIDFNDTTNAIYVVSNAANQLIYKLALL